MVDLLTEENKVKSDLCCKIRKFEEEVVYLVGLVSKAGDSGKAIGLEEGLVKAEKRHQREL